ncbi:type VI-A CRISPR-associated RNA-guided ribonuclease Cas13a [Rhodopseudomonas palustris]|uniref:type VI-A CRISPR-associated RNA-guided ribonuclease Cas13a n=1 Tax=Rhodopseudomonas palustris TaxID=1076 RepID=UPI002ACEB20D|nr:type VI-A CRISPR-associated RNA-guided ribonuclease Cas13a [Rhodopseudomonas palustris]WQG98392.1 type VI-A CRISPR-associated RNA-guided ribonuclease Cas13a [Rhodopseudomonas palustris]
MKIIRSKGQSFTAFSGKDFGRGLRVSRAGPLHFAGAEIRPEGMQEFVAGDPDLLIRQVVSALDKVIRKPRRQNLRNFTIDAYVDRTMLSLELWKRIEKKVGPLGSGSKEDEEALAELKARWHWKIHPYAEHAYSPANPRADRNADIIIKYGDKLLTSDSFRGRWHQALWRTNPAGGADYEATAEAIWSHLFECELKISGGPRSTADPREGLIQRRGRNIVSSTNDPRERDEETDTLDLDAAVPLYFEADVAARIFTAATASVQLNAEFSRTDIGQLLYDHFGHVLSKTHPGSKEREIVWQLHNTVRGFYQDIGRSERFTRAIREADQKKVGELLPHHKAHLLDIIRAKSQNADFSALIRLGKLIAHASDIPPDAPDLATAFTERLEYLATSDGQSEIKRNEAFTRVWRTSVALSLRTLQVLAPIDRKKPRPTDFDEDPAGKHYARAAVDDFEASRYRNLTGLIFGDKVIQAEYPKARRDVLFSQSGNPKKDSTANREILWALLRIAGEIRNRTNHFNTKDRLLAVLEGAPVRELRDHNQGVHNRRAEEVHPDAIAAFGSLLAFDIALRRRVALDDLERLKVREFVAPSKIDDLYAEFAQTPVSAEISAPKFMSVLRHASDLCRSDDVGAPAWLSPFGALDLSGLSKITEGANHFKVGVLRQLYGSGFAAWLGSIAGDTEMLRASVQEVIAFKRQRFEAFYAKEAGHQRHYAIAESLLNVELRGAEGLSELLRRLQTEAMADHAIRRTYQARPGGQRERMRIVEQFRLELFIRLFGRYIETSGLTWLWEIGEALPPDERDTADKLEEFPCPPWPDEIKPWHGQFYVWLYLVPVDDVALLRHQFRRTLALQSRTSSEVPRTLAELDRLMGLYLSVNAAGFSGREHIEGLDVGKVFYEKPEQFEAVYSEANETHHLSLPGTRRGLRQILRMDHHEALKGIFEKHKVTSQEVDGFAALKTEDIHRLLESKNELAKQIVAMSKEKMPDVRKLKPASEAYRETVASLALYNFRIAGARLAEHARLHQLMMRILGRLADFSLIWERDRQYVFLGLLFQTIGADHFALKVAAGDAIVLNLPPRMKEKLATAFEQHVQSGRKGNRRGAINEDQVREGILTLWSPQQGYTLEGDGIELCLLDDSQQQLFIRYFGRSDAQNIRDVEARNRRVADGINLPPQRRGAPGFHLGKRQIRNDLAHYNAISGGRRPNLTYLVNAVRSLMGHDRKMKNAVSKAVADIVREEGLEISWDLVGDRLKRPVVVPALESHLTMVKPREDFDPRFCMPQASVRFTSMVKALFDFDPGGYRAPLQRDGETKNRGELRYPEALFQLLVREQIEIPRSILEQEYPILPQK